ncbi:MAG: bifunctional methylenetetrahydrofolate dehydrogenase/methenyltetrahydrofolate cyclohydrolase FolD [Rickettsiales bacterium]|nr:bifunctional methylenetetrahydrofolate dehydrogenase/methenyltetrahydrofolate cyclohydrolase FolD [Rickettsiales bacterium]MCH2677297.1 bifunctional methylenetetrahydrofolate dehydrogenase/methenyltetrahydrofolate cyclohydrolase FolD [Alphaproteobacteria bacterium]|tara:strand:- start:716 stop:1591 length:876 start_codon:yes stop_codon:yes gene_type:complete
MGNAKIIDGKKLADKICNDVSEQADIIQKNHGIQPGLAVVLVGEDPASQIYVKNKGKRTIEVGFRSFEHKLDKKTSEKELLALVTKLNNDKTVNGILVQLPLPEQIDAQKILDAINPEKDVDGFHAVNSGKLWSGLEGMVPCTPLGCLIMLKETLKDLTGMNVVVVGRSNIVGKPIAGLLLKEHCTVTIAHSRTKDLPEVCRGADILVAAVGRAEMIKGSWIKPGCTVIDVGINRVEKEDGKTKLVGDVDFEDAKKNAKFITPVPGGVGPMTIACLLVNTLTATRRQNKIK